MVRDRIMYFVFETVSITHLNRLLLLKIIVFPLISLSFQITVGVNVCFEFDYE